MIILNLSESLAKPLVMAKLNMAYNNNNDNIIIIIPQITLGGSFIYLGKIFTFDMNVKPNKT